MLRKYYYDESHILPIQDIQVQLDFFFDEEPKAILAHEVKRLRNKKVFNSNINFKDEIMLKRERGGCNTPNYTLIVL